EGRKAARRDLLARVADLGEVAAEVLVHLSVDAAGVERVFERWEIVGVPTGFSEAPARALDVARDGVAVEVRIEFRHDRRDRAREHDADSSVEALVAFLPAERIPECATQRMVPLVALGIVARADCRVVHVEYVEHEPGFRAR